VSPQQCDEAVQDGHRGEEKVQQFEELPGVLEVEALGAQQVADALENVLDLPPLVGRLANLLQGQVHVGGHNSAAEVALALSLGVVLLQLEDLHRVAGEGIKGLTNLPAALPR